MEALANIHRGFRKSQEESEGVQEISLNFGTRKQSREERISKIRNHLEQQSKGRERKNQNVILFLLSLTLSITASCLVAYILIEYDSIPKLKAIFILVNIFLGLLVSIANNLLIAPWKEIIKLYLMVDSCVPVMIASVIGFYAMLNFVGMGSWHVTLYAICFPTMVIYFGGALRVMIAYGKCARWEIISYKLSVMSCGLIFFYVGFTYMNGGYKVTDGYLIEAEGRFRDMTYLYVFGVVEVCFEFYKRLSYFDQTEDLKY
jgi:hypothetical protein